jgi:hypothetical protein
MLCLVTPEERLPGIQVAPSQPFRTTVPADERVPGRAPCRHGNRKAVPFAISVGSWQLELPLTFDSPSPADRHGGDSVGLRRVLRE